MTAKLVEIADAVKTELAGGVFSQPFSPVRTWRPVQELLDLKELNVMIVPRGVESTSGSRSSADNNYSVDIAVRKRVGKSDQECDELTLLVEEICEFFVRRRLMSYPSAMWIGTENIPVFSPDHLEEMSVFTSVITVTYKVLG